MAADAAPHGALTRTVLDYQDVMIQLVPSVRTTADWAPLADFVATGDFVRVGTFLEVHDWDAYVDMLTQWASSIERFETTVRRTNEIGRLVYFEVEERHHRGDAVNVVNSLTVFDFDDDGRIRRLDVYLQQAR